MEQRQLEQKQIEQESYITEYDGLIQTRELQMLKSMLPFLEVKNQFPLALLIQSMEFQNTIRIFQNNQNSLLACATEPETDRRSAMLQVLRKFCTAKERETIDTMINIIFVMENYENFAL